MTSGSCLLLSAYSWDRDKQSLSTYVELPLSVFKHAIDVRAGEQERKFSVGSCYVFNRHLIIYMLVWYTCESIRVLLI